MAVIRQRGVAAHGSNCMNEQKVRRAEDAAHRFIHTPLEGLLTEDRHPSAKALELFREVAATVPAYAEFLRAEGCDPATVCTVEDFARLPVVTKDNYLRRHPLPSLCRAGKLEDCDFVAVSSGSTGEPTFWPRFQSDELSIATRFEQVFSDA